MFNVFYSEKKSERRLICPALQTEKGKWTEIGNDIDKES